MITEWHIREFLAYVSGEGNRWGLEGNGSESSRTKATYCTVHHYYCVLKAFFNWCVRESFILESPLAKIKLKNPKLNVVQPYSSEAVSEYSQHLYFQPQSPHRTMALACSSQHPQPSMLSLECSACYR